MPLVKAPPNQAQALRDLPERFGRVVKRTDDPADLQQRAWVDAATAMEHLLCVGDLLRRAGDRLEKLAAEARPLKGRLNRCERSGGYYAWDPQVVLAVFRSEAERVARIGRQLADDERLPVACRRGLELIAVELVDRLVRESNEHLQQAEMAVAGSEPGNVRGDQRVELDQ